MEKKEQKAIRATVHGRVQGVGFRYSTVNQANRLSLTGYVRNMMDGSVEVLAEGDDERLTRLINWLKKGPATSHVTKMNFNYIPYTGCYRGFIVEY